MASLDKQKILDELIYVKKEMPEVLYRDEIIDDVPVALIFDAVKKDLYQLKGNSAEIWRLLDGRRSLKMIAADLGTAIDQPDEKLLLKDVIKFIVKLGRFDLIQFAYKCTPDKENADAPQHQTLS